MFLSLRSLVIKRSKHNSDIESWKMMITENMKNTAMRYIGMPQETNDEEIKEQITQAFKSLEEIARPKVTYQRVKISKEAEKITFEGTHCQVTSKDLGKLLRNSSECILMAATLGMEVDRTIGNLQKTDMLKAMILDACASVLIDKLCDDAEAKIMNELAENEYLTMRFSPGYGDVPLETSADLLDILAAQKRIGLMLTKTHMLVPTKSITALIGISDQKENRQKSCGYCNLVQTCMYRRRGDKCGM